MTSIVKCGTKLLIHSQTSMVQWRWISNFILHFTGHVIIYSCWDLSHQHNGLTLNRWQAIIWTYDGLVYWCIYVSLGLNELSAAFNSWRPSDAIWQHRSGSTLAQAMACCLTAPSHYLNQCWLIISEVQWHSYQGNFTRDVPTINH